MRLGNGLLQRLERQIQPVSGNKQPNDRVPTAVPQQACLCSIDLEKPLILSCTIPSMTGPACYAGWERG